MRYEHRQRGQLALLVVIALAVLPLRHFLYAAAFERGAFFTPIAVLILLVLLVVGILVSSLSTEVDHGHLLWSFGPGFFRRAVPVEEIEAVEPVRLSWLRDLGMRHRDDVAAYAVAGGPGLELMLRDGRRIRLGTDDPEGLAHALREARTAA